MFVHESVLYEILDVDSVLELLSVFLLHHEVEVDVVVTLVLQHTHEHACIFKRIAIISIYTVYYHTMQVIDIQRFLKVIFLNMEIISILIVFLLFAKLFRLLNQLLSLLALQILSILLLRWR